MKKETKKLITIAELARLWGFAKSKIQYYFELGILGKPYTLIGKAMYFDRRDAIKRVEAHMRKVVTKMAKGRKITVA